MSERSFIHDLGRQALRLGERAAQELLTDAQRTQLMMGALRGVQQGRAALDHNSQRLLQSLGLATQADVLQLERQIGRLRKRLEALLAKLEESD